MNITSIQEDYLRAIYLLSEETDKGVRVSDLGKSLTLSKSTITQRLKNMLAKGWVMQERYGPVFLTVVGRKIAENLTYKHRIVELFLSKILKVPKDEAHKEANVLEHALSNSVVKRLVKFLGNPTHCPHGKKLPPFHMELE